MFKGIYTAVAARWRGRRRHWLQTHILVIALGLGAGIILAADVLPHLGYHRPVHLPITTIDTTGSPGSWAGR